jgi:hypothetical protein
MSSWFQTRHVFSQSKTEFRLLIVTKDMHTHMTYYWDRTAGPIQMVLELASTEDRNRPDAGHPLQLRHRHSFGTRPLLAPVIQPVLTVLYSRDL